MVQVSADVLRSVLRIIRWILFRNTDLHCNNWTSSRCRGIRPFLDSIQKNYSNRRILDDFFLDGTVLDAAVICRNVIWNNYVWHSRTRTKRKTNGIHFARPHKWRVGHYGFLQYWKNVFAWCFNGKLYCTRCCHCCTWKDWKVDINCSKIKWTYFIRANIVQRTRRRN